MSEEYVEQNYPIYCRGRDADGNEVLKNPVRVIVKIAKSPNSNYISSTVECPYNTGGHGQRCKASHPEVDKLGEGVSCPYGFDIPHALETSVRREFFVPKENIRKLLENESQIKTSELRKLL